MALVSRYGPGKMGCAGGDALCEHDVDVLSAAELTHNKDIVSLTLVLQSQPRAGRVGDFYPRHACRKTASRIAASPHWWPCRIFHHQQVLGGGYAAAEPRTADDRGSDLALCRLSRLAAGSIWPAVRTSIRSAESASREFATVLRPLEFAFTSGWVPRRHAAMGSIESITLGSASRRYRPGATLEFAPAWRRYAGEHQRPFSRAVPCGSRTPKWIGRTLFRQEEPKWHHDRRWSARGVAIDQCGNGGQHINGHPVHPLPGRRESCQATEQCTARERRLQKWCLSLPEDQRWFQHDRHTKAKAHCRW